MPNTLEGEPALSYLDEITDTFRRTQEYGTPYNLWEAFNTIATAISLQNAHLVRIHQLEGAVMRVPLAPTGFPTLATLLADSEAAINAYESIRITSTQAILGIIRNIHEGDSESLTEKAKTRSIQITGETEFANSMIKISEEQKEQVKKTIAVWQKPSSDQRPPRPYTMLAENNGLLSVDTFDNNSDRNFHGALKFIPMPTLRPNKDIWKSMFMVFHKRYCGEHKREEFFYQGVLPDRSGKGRSIDERFLSQNSNAKPEEVVLDRNLSSIGGGARMCASQPFCKLLTLHDSAARPMANQKIMNTIMETSLATEKLKEMIGVVKNGGKELDERQVTEQQRRMAQILKDIGSLPPDAARLIHAALNDSLQAEKAALVPQTKKPLISTIRDFLNSF